MKSDIEKPNALLVLSEIQAQSAKWEKGYREIADFKIISIEEAKMLPIEFEESPKVNQIYIQHPFKENIYILPSDNLEEYEINKLDNFSILCSILGAKSYKTILVNKDEASSSFEASADLSVPKVQVGSEMQKNTVKSISSKFKLSDEFEGNIPQYDKAYEFALKSGLSKDKRVMNLIEKRNPKYNNLLRIHRVEINLSKEINKSFEIGMSVNSFANYVGFNASFNSRSNKRESKELKIEIVF